MRYPDSTVSASSEESLDKGAVPSAITVARLLW
jgi:hypothetical protein